MIKRMALTLCSVLLLAGTMVQAASGDGYDIPVMEPKTPWISIGVSALALAGILVVAFKNAHRSHLD